MTNNETKGGGVLDEIFAYIRVTEHNYGKVPDMFLCSRDCMDKIKHSACNGAPVTMRHDNPYGVSVLVFAIPIMIANGIAKVQPFINSAEPKRLTAKTYFDLKDKGTHP